MKPRKERTIDDGGTFEVRVQFWRPEPRDSFARFQSKHMYRNVFKPTLFVLELLGTTSPTALESWFCRVHDDRGNGERCESRATPSRDRVQRKT